MSIGGKVAIILSTYNNEKIIEKTISSCFQQNYSNLEVIVADDGSKDKTFSILRKIAEKEMRLHILALPHGERGQARAKAIAKAKSLEVDYLYIIDSDMILKSELIKKCIDYFDNNTDVGALVIPEIAFSNYDNFFTKVKVFERNIINNAGERIGKNSIEAARFWRLEAYNDTGGINEKQIAFEETQPTIRYIEKGGHIRRAVFTGVYHDEKNVTLKNILEKKKYYFSVMDQTLSTEKQGLQKALQRWYFFRPVLYRKDNIVKYIKNPLLALGMVYMYFCLTFIGIYEMLKSTLKNRKNA